MRIERSSRSMPQVEWAPVDRDHAIEKSRKNERKKERRGSISRGNEETFVTSWVVQLGSLVQLI